MITSRLEEIRALKPIGEVIFVPTFAHLPTGNATPPLRKNRKTLTTSR